MFQIQVTALLGFSELVKKLGGDPVTILKSYGIKSGDLTTTNTSISLQQVVEILNFTADKLHCPLFGQRLGLSQDFRILGYAGLLISNSKTLLDALHAASSISIYHNNAEYWRPLKTQHSIFFRRYDLFHQLHDTRQYREMAMAACYRLGTILVPQKFRQVSIEFAHQANADPHQYQQHLNCPISFNCEHDQLIFPAHLATATLPDAIHQPPPETPPILDNEIVQQVTMLIQQTLSSGSLGIEQIAKLLALSKRTLQRKLAAQGIFFKKLLEQQRIEKACWYLVSSKTSITLIAEIVGYTDVANFSRAFRRVKGLSPKTWRERNRTQPSSYL
jgi:AraC-like DNA-binding protein